MSKHDVHFSSVKMDWSTPRDFFEVQNAIYNFEWDVCASKENALCENFYTEDDNALEQDWEGICWMNPPYGRAIGNFIKKAAEERLRGVTTVCLVPARTDTKWWHDHIWDEKEQKSRIGVKVNLLKGRLKFGSDEYWESIWEQEEIDGKPNKLFQKYGKKNSAPFPSALVVFYGAMNERQP